MRSTANRKGYFFILDAFIAATIIVVSLVAIMRSNVAIDQRTRDYSQSDSIAQYLLDTKLEDLNNDYVKELISNGTITDPRNTVMEQVDLFYYHARNLCGISYLCYIKYIGYAKNLVGDVSEPLISDKYGYNYVIMTSKENITIYNRSLSTWDSSSFRVVTRRLSYARINQTTLFEPHIVELSIWTK